MSRDQDGGGAGPACSHWQAEATRTCRSAVLTGLLALAR